MIKWFILHVAERSSLATGGESSVAAGKEQSPMLRFSIFLLHHLNEVPQHIIIVVYFVLIACASLIQAIVCRHQ